MEGAVEVDISGVYKAKHKVHCPSKTTRLSWQEILGVHALFIDFTAG